MKDKTSASLEALNGLLGERQRYEEWLSALESRKSSTPDSVYQKVRADYEGRLKDVADRLRARAGELKAHIETLTAKLVEISREETGHHETRQEAEVRAAVGEYSEDEWLRIRNESEKQLGRIAEDRTSTESQLAELNRVFTMSTNPGAAAAPLTSGAQPIQVAAPSAAAQPPAPPPKPAVSVEQTPARRVGTGGWPQRDGDPSASTISVAPSSGAGRTGAGTQGTPTGGSPFDEFSGLAGKPAAAAEEGKAQETKPAAAATSTKSRRGGLPDLRTEQQKTLKCPECGAMNYPTEWYCERCGGELATL